MATFNALPVDLSAVRNQVLSDIQVSLVTGYHQTGDKLWSIIRPLNQRSYQVWPCLLAISMSAPHSTKYLTISK